MNFVPGLVTLVLIIDNFLKIFAQTSVPLPPDVELFNGPLGNRPGPSVNGPNLNSLGNRAPYRQFDILPHVRKDLNFCDCFWISVPFAAWGRMACLIFSGGSKSRCCRHWFSDVQTMGSGACTSKCNGSWTSTRKTCRSYSCLWGSDQRLCINRTTFSVKSCKSFSFLF